MRRSVPVALAGLLLVAAVPAEAGQRGGHGGGHHRAPPGPCCGHPGGGAPNVNVNVNAAAQAHASAHAYAASGINAQGWRHGGWSGHGRGGGTVHGVGGGYGVVEGVQGGAVWRGPIEPVGLAGPSAPFGYVVEGFGRDYGRAVAPWDVSRTAVRHGRRDEDRPETRPETRHGGWSEAEAYAYWQGRAEDAYRAGYADGRDACDCAPPPATHRPPAADPGYQGDLPPPGSVPPRAPHPVYGHPNQPGERG